VRSLSQALSLFTRLAEGGDDRSAREQAWCHLQLAGLHQSASSHEEALVEAGKAVALLTGLQEKGSSEEIRSPLEKAHICRGRSYLGIGQTDKAQRDFAKAIALSTQLLDEGRLDHREHLAEAHRLRAQTYTGKEATRDLGKAIDWMVQLLQEGRQDQLRPLVDAYLQRAELQREDRQTDACQQDLSAAQQLLSTLQQAGQKVDEQLLGIYSTRAELGALQGLFAEVAEDSARALELAAEHQPILRARLHSLRGRARLKMLRPMEAREDFERALKIHTEALSSSGDQELLVNVAEAYGDLALSSLVSRQMEKALKEVTRAAEALEVGSQGDRRALLARTYSTRGEILERNAQSPSAKAELSKALQLLGTLVDKEGQVHLQDDLALTYRRLARTLLSLREVHPAREACNESTRRYKELWSKDRKGPWLDEISRNQLVSSAISILLKEYGAAEEEVQRSSEHFSALLDQGKAEYFEDVFRTSLQRSQNLQQVGLLPKATEELGRLIDLIKRVSAQFSQMDFRLYLCDALQVRARVAADAQAFEQAYNDYELAIQTMQPLIVEESQLHLGKEFSELYRSRSKMLQVAGHIQPAIADLSQASQVLSILLGQGREELRRPLSKVLQERAQLYVGQGELVAAVEDLNPGIELLMSLAAKGDDGDLFPQLAAMLAQRGRCYQQAQENELASQDFERAVQLYSSLVDSQGRQEFSAPLAECLLSHLSLSGQGVEDPQRLAALVKAVRLVTQQSKDGKPPEENFVIDAVTAVRNSLSLQPAHADSELTESVIKLVETILQLPRINYDWVTLTELLSQSFMALDSRKGPKYMALLCLSCVSCGREVQSLGEASLARLIYFITLLGVTLTSERPGEQLSLVGNAFSALIEFLGRQRLDGNHAANLRQLVTTWQQLPAGYPAAANVSRGVLTALLRAT
jgi:tetratricopeptide (TPR) repeat protein